MPGLTEGLLMVYVSCHLVEVGSLWEKLEDGRSTALSPHFPALTGLVPSSQAVTSGLAFRVHVFHGM